MPIDKMKTDEFIKAFKSMCEINSISLQGFKFEEIEDLIVLNFNNYLIDGIDIDCFRMLNLIYQILGPRKIKFTQQLITCPTSNRIEMITITFEKDEYETLKKILK